MFLKLYQQVLKWAQHKYASWYLFLFSAAESIFFPIPVDAMLAPMALSQPKKAWRFAAIATVGSVGGAVIGYMLGSFFADTLVMPVIEWAGYQHHFATVESWFGEWGFWAILLAGFTPIPYKVFTVGAGVLNVAFVPFILGSIIGRSGRFFLVEGLMKWGGPAMEARLIKHIEWIGWSVLLLAVAWYLLRQLG